MSGPVLLARWDDFSGGHWGAAAGGRNVKGLWGGKNVALTRTGALAPIAASRPIAFDNLADGKVHGMFWAWGADGLIYFVQDSDEGEVTIRRFDPFATPPVTIEDVGSAITATVDRLPAWCNYSGFVFLSMYGDRTYKIDPSGPSYAPISDAPGGRAITGYGERLLIGGVDDATFQTIGNRVVFSEAADLTSWPGLNFFDVGVDNTEIAGLYVMLDVLVIILEDQTIHTFRGTPGSGTATARKVYGFHAGSGGINTFTHANAVVDPAQARLWLFDHTARGLKRFNGGAVQTVPGFGILTAERTSELRTDGVMVAHGGPDDLVVDRVPVPRGVGEGARGESNMLVRVNGAFGLIDQSIVRGR